ncbi:uncharacterized protein si:dkey-262k9.2 isoform X2 [Kryptolebias marmoratus]|nr:uncharacterized protein si:dkey-262k9.2 isoform X2 [Kryptolebias marmoratus]XP_037836066.1 uncharacterized protein si:dkey-262k9.2 isoform X2 [Kryptolebias marmoratus]
MMRLVFLSLLLLLPAATAASDDEDGSGDYADTDSDDEDISRKGSPPVFSGKTDKTTHEEESLDKMPLIIIVVVATVLTLTIASIAAIMLAKRNIRLQQQAVYSVPTEQNQKEAI